MRRVPMFLLLGAVALAACGGDDNSADLPAAGDVPRAGSGYTEADVEYQLSVIAGDGTSTAAIDRYARALDAAEPVCKERRRRIGDIVVTGQRLAEEQGTPATLLELLRGIPKAVPAEIRPTQCADIVASIVVLMGS